MKFENQQISRPRLIKQSFRFGFRKTKTIPQVSIFCFSEKLFLYDLNFLSINLGLAVINAGQNLAKEYQLISVRIVKIGFLKQAT